MLVFKYTVCNFLQLSSLGYSCSLSTQLSLLMVLLSGNNLAKQNTKSIENTAVQFFLLGVFMGLGLSGIVPTMHFTIEEGFVKATTVGQMGWFYLMGAMYITGAGLYAARIPERYFPGKCDIWVSI